MRAIFMMRQNKMFNAKKHPWVSHLALVWVAIFQSVSGGLGPQSQRLWGMSLADKEG